MSVNYNEILVKVTNAIAKVGADVDFINTVSNPTDPNQPWKPGDTTANEVTVTAKAVFVSPTSIATLSESGKISDMLLRAEKVLIVDGSVDVPNLNQVVSEGQRFKIDGYEELKPANVVVLYYVALTR